MTIAAVDDHQVTLRGIRSAMGDTSDIRLVVDAPSVGRLLELLEHPVDVVVLDLLLPHDPDVADNIERVQATGAEVLIHTQAPLDVRARAALRAGALGVVGKDRLDELIEAIRLAANHLPYLSRDLAQLIASDPDPTPALSAREREVVKAVGEGLPIKSVASRMSIATDTVNDYLARARVKYALQGRPAPTRVDLFRRAMEDGLVDPPGAHTVIRDNS